MKMFDASKTRMTGLPYGEKNYDDMLSHFHLIPERYGRTDGQADRHTDGQTDRFAISISRVSVLTRDKNRFLISSNSVAFIILLSLLDTQPFEVGARRRNSEMSK